MSEGTVRSAVGRSALPLTLAVSLLAVTAYYATTLPRLATYTAGGDANLLANVANAPPLGRGALAGAGLLAADPLDQQAVSAVIAARARATGDMDRALAEAGLLRRLGWRSNVALKNLLWRAGTAGDIPLLMDTLDALLRRQRLLDQIYPILNLMTLDPEFRRLLVSRLSARPPWRPYYFQSASELSEPQQIEGRFEVMRAVQAQGDRLTRNEVAPIIPKLVEINKPATAFALWSRHHGTVASPLADPDFIEAARPLSPDALPVPFEWQLASGSGYYAEASRDERGGMLAIDWDGRGAPTLAGQLTSAKAGRYRLDVTGDPPLRAAISKVGFRLTCRSGKSVEFRPVAVGDGRLARLVADERVPCDFPELQLFGLVQPRTTAGSIVFRSLRLVRTGA